mgnify:CR=1 FL=1
MTAQELLEQFGPRESMDYDLVIVGGGPAGMICAGRAAERGLSVLLLEKNENLGKKLLITGGGRCNVTNSEFDTRTLLSKYKESDKFLFSPFSRFGVAETLDFFHLFGMDTKVEHEKRTFPVSDSSSSVLSVLVQYMQKHKVTVRTNSQVKHIHTNDATYTGQTCTIESLELTDGSIIRGLEFVVATGGKSRPETGSTGDGFSWAKKLGHTVEEPQASLVPLVSKDAWISKLSGISLPDVKIKVLLDSIPQGKAVKGKILFTHRGLSGPGILNLSKSIGELLQYGDVQVSLDLIPTKDIGTLDSLLNTLFRTEINKKLKNCLGTISSIAGVPEIPTALVNMIIELSGVDEHTPAHSITKENRRKIVNSMKDFRINIQELMGTDKAIVTSGGVILTEIDPRTLRSRKCTNLFLIGDMLHIDRPSGGYSLQLCWTTGYVAGSSAGKKIPPLLEN